jgi:tetratricopeptide (TPR) repeat protein
LKGVVHVSINVKEGEGVDLKEQYMIGNLYPVFILANSAGDAIYRWTGYLGSAPFINSLRKGLADLTTVNERKARFEQKPSYDDAVFLAQYMNDAGRYLDAIEYYRRADDLGSKRRADFSYEIFENMVSAVWREQIPFEEIFAAADEVLESPRRKTNAIIKVATYMSRVARKFDRTDRLAKYLLAGIDVTAGSRTSKMTELHTIFSADYALHIDGDTARAVEMKKASLGDDWQTNPDKFYDYAKWCQERKIMLDEAEHFARQAANRAYAGEFKGKVLNTLAEIYYEKGNNDEAIKTILLAIEQDPEYEFYEDQLKKFRGVSAE